VVVLADGRSRRVTCRGGAEVDLFEVAKGEGGASLGSWCWRLEERGMELGFVGGVARLRHTRSSEVERSAAERRRCCVARVAAPGAINWAFATAAAGFISATAAFGAQPAFAGLQEPPSRFAAVESEYEEVRFPVVWEGFRSINSQYGTVLLFHNGSETPVDINWINFNGKEVETPERKLLCQQQSIGSPFLSSRVVKKVNYAIVPPGESYLQPTFASHPWSVRDHASQKTLTLTVAHESAAVVNISSKGLGSTVPQKYADNALLSFVVENFSDEEDDEI